MGVGRTNAGGSGLRVASGTFSPASSNITEITISGIGFTPKYLYVYKTNTSWTTLKTQLKRIGAILDNSILGSSNNSNCLSSDIVWHEHDSGTTGETVNNSGATVTVNNGAATITLSTIDTLNEQGYFYGGTYYWVAIG